MLLTTPKQRLEHDNDSEDRKLIKSVLDIINPPKDQHPESKSGAADQLNKDKVSKDQQKIVLHIDDDPDDREMVNDAIKLIDPLPRFLTNATFYLFAYTNQLPQ